MMQKVIVASSAVFFSAVAEIQEERVLREWHSSGTGDHDVPEPVSISDSENNRRRFRNRPHGNQHGRNNDPGMFVNPPSARNLGDTQSSEGNGQQRRSYQPRQSERQRHRDARQRTPSYQRQKDSSDEDRRLDYSWDPYTGDSFDGLPGHQYRNHKYYDSDTDDDFRYGQNYPSKYWNSPSRWNRWNGWNGQAKPQPSKKSQSVKWQVVCLPEAADVNSKQFYGKKDETVLEEFLEEAKFEELYTQCVQQAENTTFHGKRDLVSKFDLASQDELKKPDGFFQGALAKIQEDLAFKHPNQKFICYEAVEFDTENRPDCWYLGKEAQAQNSAVLI